MKKTLFLLFIASLITINVSNISFAEEFTNKLESESLQLIDINVNLNGPSSSMLKATFVLKNKTLEVLKTKMHMKRIALTDGHTTEFCYGECTFFPSEFEPNETERTTSQFDLEPNATTNPSTNSYIKMKPDGTNGCDTILYTIFNVDDEENDFVQFLATWDFNDGSIKILNNFETKVYPTPAITHLYLSYNSINSNSINKNIEKIEIYNLAGELLQTENILQLDVTNELKINISALQNGTYIGFLLQDKNKISMFKFIK